MSSTEVPSTPVQDEKEEDEKKHKQKNQPLLILKEKWDTQYLGRLAASRHLSEPQALALVYTLANLTNANGNGHCISRTYTRPSRSGGPPTTTGRQYCIGSLQDCPNWVQRIVTHRLYRDIDMVNAGPTLLLAMAKSHRLRVPVLARYVADREKILRDLQAQTELDRATLKNFFIKACYGGGYRKVYPRPIPLLNRLVKEMRKVHSFLFRHPTPDQVTLKRQVVADASKTNKEGSFAALLVFQEEDRVLEAMQQFFLGPRGQRNTDQALAAVLKFDGILLERTEEEPNLRGAEAYIRDKTNFDIQLKVKPLEPTPEDWQKLSQCGPDPPPILTQLQYTRTERKQRFNLLPHQRMVLMELSAPQRGFLKSHTENIPSTVPVVGCL
jgi:hypothetical protein